MTTELLIEFEKGGRFTAVLFEDKAPKTCQFVLDHLPITGKIGHGRFSGEMMYFLLDLTFDELENPSAFGFLPGDIVYMTPFYKDIPNELAIIYGPKTIIQHTCGLIPSNHFARIIDNLDELAQIGIRTHEQGLENIIIKKKE